MCISLDAANRDVAHAFDLMLVCVNNALVILTTTHNRQVETLTFRNAGLRICPDLHIQLFEQRHNKTNKVTVPPAKTQISLGIRPV